MYKHPLTQHQRVLLFVAILLLIDIFAFYIWHSRDVASRYDPIILQVSRQHEINPALIKAVIWRESKFNANAQGNVGEIGLMQIRELTATEWCRENKVTNFPLDHLYNPQTNITVGTWYLKKMLKRYADTDNPLVYALCDYNAGRRKVLEWADGEARTNSKAFLSNISYPTTKSYIETITEQKHHYEISNWRRSSALGWKF